MARAVDPVVRGGTIYDGNGGEVTYRDGEATGAQPGGLVRRAHAAPKATAAE